MRYTLGQTTGAHLAENQKEIVNQDFGYQTVIKRQPTLEEAVKNDEFNVIDSELKFATIVPNKKGPKVEANDPFMKPKLDDHYPASASGVPATSGVPVKGSAIQTVEENVFHGIN